jgi:HD-GYP domain-containing protein (c-di-GMP phosphodiesterase class II)
VASGDFAHAAVVDPETALVERARTAGRLRPEAREALVAAIGGMAFLLAATAILLSSHSARQVHLPTAALLVVSFALATQVRFEMGSGFAFPTQLIFAPMALALPAHVLPFAVATGLLLGSAPQFLNGSMPATKAPLVLVNSWYAIGPALVLLAAGDPAPGWNHWRLYLGALAAQFAFDYAAAAGWARAAYDVSVVGHFRATAVLPFVVDAALGPLGVAIGIKTAHQPFALLVIFPLLGLLGYFAREREVRIDHALELSSAYRGTALLLGDVIEADDAYTGSHSRDVVELVVAVTERLGLDAGQRRDAEFAALLHDVGKVRIPTEIINKPGPLDPAERAIINTHTIEGERMLRQVGGLLERVGKIVRSCHERWDGEGYPDGLRGEEIPLVARIVCCCDAFNAMTTDRAYRRALSLADAKAELIKNRATQFDATVVDALLAVVE